MRKVALITIAIMFLCFVFPAPKAKAMDPVTMSLLAPVALQVASIAAPYIIRGLTNAGKGLILCGKDLLEFFLLPIGMFEASFGAPFGLFGLGVKHMFYGAIAPAKLIYHTLTVPIRLFMISGG